MNLLDTLTVYIVETGLDLSNEGKVRIWMNLKSDWIL